MGIHIDQIQFLLVCIWIVTLNLLKIVTNSFHLLEHRRDIRHIQVNAILDESRFGQLDSIFLHLCLVLCEETGFLKKGFNFNVLEIPLPLSRR